MAKTTEEKIKQVKQLLREISTDRLTESFVFLIGNKVDDAATEFYAQLNLKKASDLPKIGEALLALLQKADNLGVNEEEQTNDEKGFYERN